MNDIKTSSSFFKFILFADDTSLFSTPNLTTNNNDSVLINDEFQKVQKWLKENKLSLNAKKTKFIIFHNSGKNFISPILMINDIQVEVVDHHKFLGFYIDQGLNWNLQIDYVCNKMSRSIGALNRLKNILPMHVKLMIYNSLIACHFNVGLLSWGNNTKIKRILKLQKKSVRIIMNKHYKCHADPLFKKLGLLKINDMLVLAKLKFFYKYNYGLLPERLLSISCISNSNVHN